MKVDDTRLLKIYHEARKDNISQEGAMQKVQAHLIAQKEYETKLTE